jgi:hypothetical protein
MWQSGVKSPGPPNYFGGGSAVLALENAALQDVPVHGAVARNSSDVNRVLFGTTDGRTEPEPEPEPETETDETGRFFARGCQMRLTLKSIYTYF